MLSSTTLPKSGGIYKIVCQANKKIYVGSTFNLKRRKNDHEDALLGNYHKNPSLQASWNKYGPNAFQFEIIELVRDISALVLQEQHWISSLGCSVPKGFNMCPVAGSTLGRPVSQESRRKMSVAKKGKRYTKKRRQQYLAQIKMSNPGKIHLTDRKVFSIKKAIARGVSLADLAKKYQVSYITISHVKNGTTWKHIPPDLSTFRLYNRGERAGNVKLTEKQVLSIKKRLTLGESQSLLAREFGVGHDAIHKIKNNVNWVWVLWPKL